TAAEAAHPDGTSAADVGSAPLGDAGTAESVRARATGSNPDGTVRSVASVGSLSMDIGMARLRTGRITATCTAAPGSTPRGSTSVNDGSFTVHGLPALKLPTDPAPGTVVVLPGGLGELVLNEQTRDANGALTVTGLRLTLSDATEKYRGRMVAASTRCAAGKADPASVEAHVVDAQAGDADEDRALAGV
ncbi:choice-of-anchor P family protein, partial [Streptomyces sparsus]